MFASLWSSKGGTGTTVAAASLALVLARTDPLGAVLVDLAGDAPAALGVASPDGPGISDWLAAGPSVPPDALARLEVPVADGLVLVPRGDGPLEPATGADLLAAALAGEPRSVVVDCGVLDVPGASGSGEVARVLAAAATTSLLVIRPCYLALRRATRLALRPSGVVLVCEHGRALDARDVEQVLGAPVWAELPVDAAVARAVDAGILATRLPRVLERALTPAAA